MQLFTYENPQIIDHGDLKPVPYEMMPFPYNQLANDRRFEELVYSLYQSAIDQHAFKPYTEISLMNGVRDYGSDCCLIKDGKNFGLIQCKKYGENYAKADFGQEITKFAMYYLLDHTLIADLNDFTYYIAVSKGFVSNCTTFIKDFNRNILTEAHLDKWIGENLKSATLRELGLGNVKAEVLEVLTRISVKQILPQDLDVLLTKPYNGGLASLFFAVRSVTDNSVLQKGLASISSGQSNALSEKELKQELKTGSATISSQQNTISEIPDSHMERAETKLLYNWVTTSCEVAGYFKNICLLAGGAGYGKTVIMKDLYEQLNKNNIPCLALKADKLYVSNFKELQEKINISVPIREFIDQCKQHFETLVIIIDQIDALSQSLSSNRSFLDTYVGLIEGYKNDPIVRVIISVRYFDLLYDPALRPYKDIKTIEVKTLAVDDVKKQLVKIGLSDKSMSSQLLELLRVPNNLNVFSRIYKDVGDFAGVNSIQGLYSELWNAKIDSIRELHQLDTGRVKDALFLIAAEMYRRQQIAVSEKSFDTYANELKYLKSEQLITFDNTGLQFFHQSFYDYVFARQFVESRSSLFRYLKKQNQSILARAALKMILNYLREVDPESYLKQVSRLLNNRTIRFHVHHLVLSTVAAVEIPTVKEKELLHKIIKKDKIFFIPFCEQVSGGWISYFIQCGLIDEMLFPEKVSGLTRPLKHLLKKLPFLTSKSDEIAMAKPLNNLALAMLQKNISVSPELVLPYLKRLENKTVVLNLLYHLNDWGVDGAIAVLESCGEINLSEFRYSGIFEHLLPVNPNYVFERTKAWLVDASSNISNDQHRKETLLEKLFETIPELTFQYLFQYFTDRIDELKYDDPNKPLIQDYIIYDINFDLEHLHGDPFLFQQMLVFLQESAKANSEFYQSFLTQHLRSNYLSVQRAIIHSYSGNEKQHREFVFQTFMYLNAIGALNSFDVLSDALRSLLKASLPIFKKQQVNELLKMINLIPESDYFIFTRDDKKVLSTRFGQNKYRYLLCLPNNLINSFPKLKRKFNEYQRRYPNITIIQTDHGRGGMVHPPLSSDAYEKMNYNAWMKSFQKFDQERGMNAWGDDFLKGGLSEHAQAFKNSVKKFPKKFIPILDSLFDDWSIKIDYHISGLTGLMESNHDPVKVLSLFKLLITQNLTGYFILSSLRIADYLIRNDINDEKLIDYVFYKAENDPDPEENNNLANADGEQLIAKGIGSVRGAAAHALCLIQEKDLEDRVFDALIRIADNDTLSVIAAILYRLAYLMNLNRDRAFGLFIKILNNEQHTWQIETAWSLSYLVHYDFIRLLPYLRRVLASELNEKTAESFGNISFGAYYNNYENAKDLLYSFMVKFPKIRPTIVGNALKYIHMNETSYSKSIALLEELVIIRDKEIESAFHTGFLHAEHITFEELYPFLKKYVNNDAITGGEYFLQFLLTHCHSYPEECLQLFEFVVHHVNQIPADEFNQHHYNYEEDSVNLIIGIYNSLRPERNLKHQKDQEKLLTLFDTTLRDSRFKSNTDKLLEKIIY